MALQEWKPAPVLAYHLAIAPPAYLSHYTNQAGMLGILQSHRLWASNIRFLNDHREYEFGVGRILGSLRNLNDLLKGDAQRRVHTEAMLQAATQDENPFITSVYVASWSDTDDDLGQWRAYSGNSTGFAIRMRGARLKELADAQQYLFAKCIYDPRDQQRAATEIVNTSLQEMFDDARNNVQYDLAGPADKFLFRLRRFAPLFKDQAFAAEQEWRLISTFIGAELSPTFAVREGRSMPVPYICFELKTADSAVDISEIVVGPCAELERSAQATHAALMKYVPAIHAQTRAVRQSRVPYRNW